MSSRVWAIVMAGLLLLYIGAVAQLAVRLWMVDELAAKGLGVALIVLPIVGVWALIVELMFGIRSQRLGRELANRGEATLSGLSVLPSGRVDRKSADAAFGSYQAAAESAPDQWESWYRLGLAYDACGDRRRGRQAIRRAISLERTRVPSK